MKFQPDYNLFIDVMKNIRPKRLPIYEHIVSPNVMEKILETEFASLYSGNKSDLSEFFRNYSLFFKEMTYDIVSFEECITTILPGGGAIHGGKVGPIQTRSDFESYPWNDLPKLFEEHSTPKFEALIKSLPPGMKAVGGIGNGVFEISEDLVGLEYLPFMMLDYPDLYDDLYKKIGDTMCMIWKNFLDRYKDSFAVCRFGDDLGFRSSLLTNPQTIKNNIIPQYKRVINIIHDAGKPFLLHSCGCIFDIMEDLIQLGIQAKHSNEDAIAPFDRWIQDYGDRIAVIGGFDMDFLCSKSENDVYSRVLELGTKYRKSANGYALGSGNSIPDYVPVENYLAMIRAAQEIRELESKL
ncbi:MAG TPA: uroporphyrinogen decarboxylase family protein [Victivallales bacterium]|nr:uroporphyrinogen decarboxylase family protein [Victivallales bacterium]